MKRTFAFLSALILCQWASLAQVNMDNIFCLGNGKMAVYESGGNIIQLFGPPYSSPSLFRITFADSSITIKSERERGTAIWKHTLIKGGKAIGTVLDFVDSALPCLVRKFDLTQPVSFSLETDNRLKVIPNTSSYKLMGLHDALLCESPRGIPFYNDYPMPFKQYFQILAQHSVQVTATGSANTFIIHCGEGEGFFYVVGGPLYPDCISNTHSLLSLHYDDLLNRTRAYWNGFTARRLDFGKTVPENAPSRDKLLKTIDDVAINIKTQQGEEGAVIAGHNYHLGYIRDQYGVSRCLLKLGYYREAHDILNFYWKIWKAKGTLHNAQGVGVDAFHIHENDEVEITGYLIIQAFDYLKCTKDNAFVKEIFPMLEWAWNCQKRNLAKNMLPFNGDETYVAGGVLPRSALIDGSAEATLLFITAGTKLLEWAGNNKSWCKDTLAENKKILQETMDHYRPNFFENNHLYANNPDRSTGIELPQFRHGVCESYQDGKHEGCESFGWNQKNENNRYLCPVCFARFDMSKAEPKRYLLQSVSLMPLYIGSKMFSEKEIATMVDEIIDQYKNTGRLPSRPDGNTTVGYDYGLLLYNLTFLNSPLQQEIYDKMLSIVDETGSWVEYYENGKPRGTRYRPWESAINLEAAINFAEKYK